LLAKDEEFEPTLPLQKWHVKEDYKLKKENELINN